jgi:hypothetical protein
MRQARQNVIKNSKTILDIFILYLLHNITALYIMT